MPRAAAGIVDENERGTTMVTARSHKNQFGQPRTPRPVSSDSDVVVLALVTAQALEGQGHHSEAARWLRRASWQAKLDGSARRAMQFARSAAQLASVPTTRSSRHDGSHGWERPARHSYLRATLRDEPDHGVTPHPANTHDSSEAASNPQSPARASVWQAMLTLMGAAG
jgi:hypothetical protein